MPSQRRLRGARVDRQDLGAGPQTMRPIACDAYVGRRCALVEVVQRIPPLRIAEPEMPHPGARRDRRRIKGRTCTRFAAETGGQAGLCFVPKEVDGSQAWAGADAVLVRHAEDDHGQQSQRFRHGNFDDHAVVLEVCVDVDGCEQSELVETAPVRGDRGSAKTLTHLRGQVPFDRIG